MPANYNKLILIGTVTNTPQLKYLPNDKSTPVVNFSLVYNEKYGEKEETMFIDCEAFGRTAENINKYFTKGKNVMLDGKIKQKTWESNGQRRSKHVMNVWLFTFIDSGGQQADEPAQESHSGPSGGSAPF